jgi:hypothetical protein
MSLTPQIKQESFVEDINNLLNSGEVPNMFPYDERAAVLEQCRGLSKKEGLSLDTAVSEQNVEGGEGGRKGGRDTSRDKGVNEYKRQGDQD